MKKKIQLKQKHLLIWTFNKLYVDDDRLFKIYLK